MNYSWGTFASVALEQHEIASHEELIAMAAACNERSVGEVCRQNLREEEAWPGSSTAASSR